VLGQALVPVLVIALEDLPGVLVVPPGFVEKL